MATNPCATLTLPDGYNGHTVELTGPWSRYPNQLNDGVVKLSTKATPHVFSRWARVNDLCVVCGHPVSAHMDLYTPVLSAR